MKKLLIIVSQLTFLVQAETSISSGLNFSVPYEWFDSTYGFNVEIQQEIKKIDLCLGYRKYRYKSKQFQADAE